MSMLNGFIVAAALAASTAVVAQPAAHLTDMQYLAAVRCRALIASPALGKEDTSAIDAVLKTEGRGRIGQVLDRADQVRYEATLAASRAGRSSKADLIAERDSACKVYAAGSGSVTGSAAGS